MTENNKDKEKYRTIRKKNILSSLLLDSRNFMSLGPDSKQLREFLICLIEIIDMIKPSDSTDASSKVLIKQLKKWAQDMTSYLE